MNGEWTLPVGVTTSMCVPVQQALQDFTCMKNMPTTLTYQGTYVQYVCSCAPQYNDNVVLFAVIAITILDK